MSNRLLAAVDRDISVNGHSLRAGLSIGIAIFPTDGGDVTTLIANANAALYRAKEDGRGTFRFFKADMRSPCSAVPAPRNRSARHWGRPRPGCAYE